MRFVGMKTEYRLDELFDLQMGKTPARNNPTYWDSDDHKWISIADLSKCGKYITDTKEYLSEKAVKESGISQIPKNTVIMSLANIYIRVSLMINLKIVRGRNRIRRKPIICFTFN